MRVTAEEYGHLITDQCGFKLECVSWVKETNQVFTCNDDFRLRRPDLTVKVQSRQESNNTLETQQKKKQQKQKQKRENATVIPHRQCVNRQCVNHNLLMATSARKLVALEDWIISWS